ncbi:hypothetical protein DV451_001079 [Geotrichum candidum]|uniref:NECAP PHear domain-containing protein n=1 Tax=Geotrichum candidum TaxID=1173061 RepID=A0A0J9XHD6_GEOCN|nr:hypothetical protein DV451_001079 [Geotrichum candidum]KAI9214362.1 hypothetical protein DS838_000740 [Geotrichum bryndzae]KAF5108400.1 hypothetical protein DV453_002360 [Geotrichum candidum]KAF5115232.1 hypothetical protein DV452_003051 [Geotrichum candidum]KAF5129012.1 hypothetical protein DV495_002719 [Geotrichum candidum]
MSVEIDNSLERTLYASSSVQIYQVPPLKSLAQGHRAAGWDVSNPIWEGSLRVLEIEDLTTGALTGQLRLFDTQSGELFAAAPYTKDGKGIEPVSDSGRYFAVRVVNGTQSAVLGLGFKDRSEAFEFNLALQDFRKHASAGDDAGLELQDTNKFSLKEGQKIHINIKGSSGAAQEANAETSDEPAQIALLPPPPSSRRESTEPTEPAGFDDDFGDFQ